MSIVKFEFSVPEFKKSLESFASNRIAAFETIVVDVRRSVGDFLSQVLNAEMSVFLGQPDQADNKRNGYQFKDYTLKGIGSVRLKVPVDRRRRFESDVVPKRERVDPRVSEDIAALHLAGISTRTLAMMSQRILGLEVSHQTVSNSLDAVSDLAIKWLKRPIDEKYWALIVDGTNFHVRRRESVETEPSLVVLGMTQDNRRSILAIEPGTRDSAEAWRTTFRSLKLRGLDADAVKLGVMDGLPGLEKVFREEFPKAETARCWFHAMQNALAKTPKRLRDAFHVLARKVMYANGEVAAKTAFDELKQAMGNDCERAVKCLEKDLNSLTTHYKFPEPMWRALKTTNAVERIHKEFKRRSRAMEAMGEKTLTTLLAFTALRLEMAWRRRGIDTYKFNQIRPQIPFISGAQQALEDPDSIH